MPNEFKIVTMAYIINRFPLSRTARRNRSDIQCPPSQRNAYLFLKPDTRISFSFPPMISDSIIRHLPLLCLPQLHPSSLSPFPLTTLPFPLLCLYNNPTPLFIIKNLTSTLRPLDIRAQLQGCYLHLLCPVRIRDASLSRLRSAGGGEERGEALP
jgi:hypothetical protein